MYQVKITERKGKRTYTKTIDFVGELDDETKKQWDNILKYASNDASYTFLSYSNKQEVRENEQI